jgi:hypothetical protein
MTRDHAPAQAPAEDPYAAHRCVNCPHIVYADDVAGERCRWAGMPGGGSGKACECTDHRLAPGGRPRTAREVLADAAQNDPDAS